MDEPSEFKLSDFGPTEEELKIERALSEELGEVLFSDLASCATREDKGAYIRHRLTKSEIKEFNARIRVQEAIEAYAIAGQEVVIRAIARQTKASPTLVSRVHNSMLTNKFLPQEGAKFANFWMALPQEKRPQEQAIHILVEGGFRIIMPKDGSKTAIVVDRKDGIAPIRCGIARGGDIVADYYYNQISPPGIALIGNDKMQEFEDGMRLRLGGKMQNALQSRISVPTTYRDGYFDMYFAIPNECQKEAQSMPGLDYLQGKRIVTSYPNMATMALSKNGIAAEILEAEGGTEAKCRTWGDGIFEIKQSGESLDKAFLTTLGDSQFAGNVSMIAPHRAPQQDEDYALFTRRLQSVQLENSRR